MEARPGQWLVRCCAAWPRRVDWYISNPSRQPWRSSYPSTCGPSSSHNSSHHSRYRRHRSHHNTYMWSSSSNSNNTSTSPNLSIMCSSRHHRCSRCHKSSQSTVRASTSAWSVARPSPREAALSTTRRLTPARSPSAVASVARPSQTTGTS